MKPSRNVKMFPGSGDDGLLRRDGLLCMDGLKDHQDQPKFQLEGKLIVLNLLTQYIEHIYIPI